MDNSPKRTDLYRHYDKDNNLLYVGISLNPVIRLMQHRVGSGWYEDIQNITIERFDTEQQARDAERDAIQTENPKYNIQRNCTTTNKYKNNTFRQLIDSRHLSDDHVAGLLSVSAYTIGVWRRGQREMPDSLIELLQLKLDAADTLENVQIDNMITEFNAVYAANTGNHKP